MFGRRVGSGEVGGCERNGLTVTRARGWLTSAPTTGYLVAYLHSDVRALMIKDLLASALTLGYLGQRTHFPLQ